MYVNLYFQYKNREKLCSFMWQDSVEFYVIPIQVF